MKRDVYRLDQFIRSEYHWYSCGMGMAKSAYIDKTLQTREQIGKAVIYMNTAVNGLLHIASYVDLRKFTGERSLFIIYSTLSEATRSKIEETYNRYKLENMKDEGLPAFRITVDIESMPFYKTNESDGLTEVLVKHDNVLETWRHIINDKKDDVYAYNFGYMDACFRAIKDVIIELGKKNVIYM